MGHLMPVDEAYLVDIPTGKVVTGSFIRSGDWIFIRHDKSKWNIPSFSVCRHYGVEKWAFPLSVNAWSWQKSFMDVLVKLGLMSKGRRNELIEADRIRHEKAQRKDDCETLMKLASRYGITEIKVAANILNPTRESVGS